MVTFLHIGMHKTGTTSLQKHVFPRMQPLVYSTRQESLGSEARYVPLTAALHKCRYKCKSFDHVPGAENAYLDSIKIEYEDARLELPPDTPLLISDELLVSSHTDGNHAVISRLRKVVGPAKIIIVFRDPLQYLISLYRQNFLNTLSISVSSSQKSRDKIGNRFQFFSINAYFDLIFKNGDKIIQEFDYDGILKSLDQTFGEDNVLALDFDVLANRFEDFLNTLCSFMGVRLDAGFHPSELPRENRWNGRLEPLLNQLQEANTLSQDQIEKLQQWYDSAVLTPDQIDILTQLSSRQCAAAFDRCADSLRDN